MLSDHKVACALCCPSCKQKCHSGTTVTSSSHARQLKAGWLAPLLWCSVAGAGRAGEAATLLLPLWVARALAGWRCTPSFSPPHLVNMSSSLCPPFASCLCGSQPSAFSKQPPVAEPAQLLAPPEWATLEARSGWVPRSHVTAGGRTCGSTASSLCGLLVALAATSRPLSSRGGPLHNKLHRRSCRSSPMMRAPPQRLLQRRERHDVGSHKQDLPPKGATPNKPSLRRPPCSPPKKRQGRRKKAPEESALMTAGSCSGNPLAPSATPEALAISLVMADTAKGGT